MIAQAPDRKLRPQTGGAYEVYSPIAFGTLCGNGELILNFGLMQNEDRRAIGYDRKELLDRVLTMTTQQLEARLATLEEEMAQVKRFLIMKEEETRTPWWEKIAGSFADDPDFDEAERLGREWRKSAQDDWLDVIE